MMQQTLLVYSRDSRLTSELVPLVNSQFDVRACDSEDEVYDLLRRVQPTGLLADLRNASPDAAAEQRILRSLAAILPDVRMAVLTDERQPRLLDEMLNRENVLCVERLSELTELVAHLLKPTSGVESAANQEPVPDAVSGPDTALDPETVSPPDTVVAAHTASDVGAAPADAKKHDVRAEEQIQHVAPSDAGRETVLTGVTRKFETYSASVRQMLADLEIAARHDVTILLIGETGAGKTFLSRLIHEISPRREEPFVPLACGALPADLIESELFGHVKGAFTSAHADKDGKFLAVRRGTLLLDEIDVLGLEQQVKLLRVIETGEFEPVGSNRTHHCEGRLVVASNLDLPPLVEQGRFRPDLYYRLNMLKFVVPPLRKRKEDIIPLARKFVRAMSAKHNVVIDEIDGGVFNVLLSYPWPGNVRELENVMQRAVIYCRDRRLVRENLPAYLLSGQVGPGNEAGTNFGTTPVADAADDSNFLGDQIALTEKEIIEHTLQRNGCSRTKSARELGISRVTLYNKMKKYKIQ